MTRRLTSILSGLLLLTSVPGQAAPQSAAAAIASRSYSSGETGRILDRSGIQRHVSRPRASSKPRVSAVAVPQLDAPGTLDAVSIERTERYTELINHHARRRGLDSDLIKAIIYAESGGDRQAVSASGAIGLMQLMPQTAGDLKIADPFDAAASIDGGTRYLRSLLDRYGSTEIALWAYNAGPGAVDRGYLPDETVTYVPRVLTLRNHFQQRGALAAASR